MPRLVALLDANVLYPAPIRDLLLQLAGAGHYRARWSDDIHEEWIRNVLADRPDLNWAQLTRTRELMDRHIRDARVEQYHDLIAGLTLPDLNDRHVLAAAIAGGATSSCTTEQTRNSLRQKAHAAETCNGTALAIAASTA